MIDHSQKPKAKKSPNLERRKAYIEIENLLITKPNQLDVKRGTHLVPSVFYIGRGKVGSSSIYMGFPDETVAHWHFEKFLDDKMPQPILANNSMTLFELIRLIGSNWEFKPLIVESVRDPIAKTISGYMHLILDGRKRFADVNALLNHLHSLAIEPPSAPLTYGETPENYIFWEDPYAAGWKDNFSINLRKDFEPDKGFFVKETDNATCVFLRFENINMWPGIFQDLGYRFLAPHTLNMSSTHLNEFYLDVKRKFRLPRDVLENMYNRPWLSALYTERERENFIDKWSIK